MPVGNPGDFDFLAGEWRIHHRQLKNKATIKLDGPLAAAAEAAKAAAEAPADAPVTAPVTAPAAEVPAPAPAP